jgi:hypothetical protein
MDEYLNNIIYNSGEHSSGEWVACKIYNFATGLMRIVGGCYRNPGGYGEGTMETIHKSVRTRMMVIPGWSSKAMEGWTWKAGFQGEEGYWEKPDGTRLYEEPLRDVEKILAGRVVVKDMLGENMP